MTNNDRQHGPTEQDLPVILSDFFAERKGADDDLCSVLRGPVAAAVGSFLGRDNIDADDVIQESLVAVVQYLKRRGEFEGNIVRFAVTIARNRCRNIISWNRRRPQVEVSSLADWIASPDRSPLDTFLDSEVLAVMRDTFKRLDEQCRSLLTDLFLNNRAVDAIRESLGLSTVRAVYYRREACLEQLHDAMRLKFGDA